MPPRPVVAGAASTPVDSRREEVHSDDDVDDEDVEGEDEDEDSVLSEFQSSLVLDGETGTALQHRGPTNVRDRTWRCASLHFLQLAPWAQAHHRHRATELRALAHELRV
jgi:hypothetical protein